MSAQTDSHQLPLEADHARRVASKLSFATDEQLASWLRPVQSRLAQIENAVAHFKATIPGLERECAAIRQNVTAVLSELDREPS